MFLMKSRDLVTSGPPEEDKSLSAGLAFIFFSEITLANSLLSIKNITLCNKFIILKEIRLLIKLIILIEYYHFTQ